MANVDGELASGGLPEDVLAFLAQAGIKADLADRNAEHPGLQVFVGLLESSWSLDEASEVLSASTDEVVARIARGDLYGFAPAHGMRVPVWQVLGGRPIPWLARLLESIPPGVHPSTLEAFMTTPDPEWHGMSPVEWLVTGGAVEPLADSMREHWSGD